MTLVYLSSSEDYKPTGIIRKLKIKNVLATFILIRQSKQEMMLMYKK